MKLFKMIGWIKQSGKIDWSEITLDIFILLLVTMIVYSIYGGD